MTLSIPEIILAVIIATIAIGFIEFLSWTLAIFLGSRLDNRKENKNEKEKN